MESAAAKAQNNWWLYKNNSLSRAFTVHCTGRVEWRRVHAAPLRTHTVPQKL